MTPWDKKTDRRIGWALFALGFFLLLFTEKPAGFVRDESVYFHAGESHGRWFQLLLSNPSQALGDDAISQHYGFNNEHPALMKNLFGLSFILFHEKLNLLRPAAAFRVPAFAFAALLLPLVYALGRRKLGRLMAAFVAFSFLIIPRQFFESHLSCFDVPIATMWVLVVYCFIQALERPRYWVATGIAFGLALATKHNAFFIPTVIIPFSLFLGIQSSNQNSRARNLFLGINGLFIFAAILYGLMVSSLGLPRFQQTFLFQSPQLILYVATVVTSGFLLKQLYVTDEKTFSAIAPLWAMAALGPIIFYIHWPYLWHHPVDRTAAYLAFHATHNHYAWFYLGEVLRAPPFPLFYVIVKTALTVPTSLFVPMCLGFAMFIFKAFKKQVSVVDCIIAVNAVASIAIISHPQVPHFGGVKHWFPSMPFLALLMGESLERAVVSIQNRFQKFSLQTVGIALVSLVAIPAIIATVRVGEFGTSSYSELAGGLPGAASLGMQRQFWANNVTGVLPWINEHARPGERVYLHENHGGQVRDYQRNQMLRTDLNMVNSPFEADIVAYQYHQEFREFEFMTWQAFGTTVPVFGLYLDETPQIVVYRRP
jgi:4-amino-4-deoxy-L-arabinose transferase-like glycosyltransferase